MRNRGNIRNLLLVVLFLVFLALGCSESSNDFEPTTSSDEPRYISKAPTPEPTVEPNNDPSYWATCCQENRYENLSYDSLVPKDEADLKKDVELAKRSEADFLKAESKAENVSDLEYALIFYARAALKDESYLHPALINMEKGIKFGAEPCDMAEHTLALLEKYPANTKLKSFLPGIKNALLLDLKKEQYFDVRKSYVNQESWRDVYGTGVYAIRNIDFLSRIATKVGDKKDQAKWQRYIAEYHLSAHAFDGEYSENVPTISYAIYTKLGDVASAKKAAVLVGHNFLGAYLDGNQNGLGDTTRTFGLPYDLEQAKLWFKKGGLDDSQIFKIINEQRNIAMSMLPSCTTRKECSTENWDNKEFLENLKIEAIS